MPKNALPRDTGFDMLQLWTDTANPEGAPAFVNFILCPDITANVTAELPQYCLPCQCHKEALPPIDPEIAPDSIATLRPSVTRDA